jgi:hypothetical protein
VLQRAYAVAIQQLSRLGSFWEIKRMRNLAILAALVFALALAGCSVGNIKLGTNDFKGQPLSAVVAKLGSPEEQGMIEGQKTYTWIRGNAMQECRIRVVMAGDLVDTYEGFGDVGTCSQYGALAGGLKGFGGSLLSP